MLEKIANLSKTLSPNFRRILGNTAWLFSEKVFQLGLGLLVGVWVARYLKPEGFGIINYSLAYVGLLEPFSRLGLNNIIVRDLARDPSQKEETLGSAFVLRIIASLISFCIIVSTILWVKRDSPATQWAVAFFSLGSVVSSFGIIEFWFQSQVEAKYVVWARNSAYIFINIVKVTLIQLKAPLIAFVIALVLEQALAYIGMVFVYQWRGNLLRAWKVSLVRAKSLLQQSWPLIISGFVIFIYMRVDQIMLGSMKGVEAVGIYSAAVKVSEMWYFVPISIVQSVFPSVVQAKDISQAVYNQRIQKIFNLMVLVGYGVAIPITFIAPQLILFMYGANYAPAASMLTILVWSGVFASLGVARETCLTTEGLMKFSAATAAIGAGINVVLNFLLIPQYSGTGAAIATVVSQIFAVYLSSALYPQTRSIFIRQTKALTLLGLVKPLLGFFKT
ncbi:flippase [Lusitaniella coriacea]|uniref:flippase n=1 Tax=Lusitaniella coriacea TaxID=1983105 RepID=UPI003CEC7169